MYTRENFEKSGMFDVKVTDKSGESFYMGVADNGDLYWMPDRKSRNSVFQIDPTNRVFFEAFGWLFESIKETDDAVSRASNGNIVAFMSDDAPIGFANVVVIEKIKGSFNVTFMNGKTENGCVSPSGNLNIRLANSGSRNPRVQSLFMKMYKGLSKNANSSESFTGGQESI